MHHMRAVSVYHVHSTYTCSRVRAHTHARHSIKRNVLKCDEIRGKFSIIASHLTGAEQIIIIVIMRLTVFHDVHTLCYVQPQRTLGARAKLRRPSHDQRRGEKPRKSNK